MQVQAFHLGSLLRKEYFEPSSANYIHNVRNDLVDLDQVHARIKVGGEGRVAFDSTIALLQGLFPPTEKNTIELANETKVTAPLGGYQYIPGEPYTIFADVFCLTLLQLKPWSLSTTVPSKAGRAAR